MSPSEVHASVKRVESSQLLHGRELQHRPNFSALKEFLIHGLLRYVFPAELGGNARNSDLLRRGTTPLFDRTQW
jgi:hypothetical protein